MNPSDFTSHLEELRQRLLISLAAFVVVTIAAFFFSEQLLNFLTEPLRKHQDVELFFHRPYEAFLTHLKVAALTGVVVTCPIFLTQLWLFIAPGLYENEKRIIFPLSAVSIALFLTGALFAYFVVIPWGLHFLLSYETEGMKALLGVGPYFSFLTGMIIAFGVLFDFPVILVGLVKLDVLRTETLRKMRRVFIVLIFIAAAVLTPSPDPISQLLLAVPLLLLFEISLWIANWIENRKR